jgi:hypothetical protein
MSIESNESTLLIAFARAASKSQAIETLLQETLISVEVAKDARDGSFRSFQEIAEKIEKLPLGQLKRRYLETVGKDITDPLFRKMWDEINEERIFLIHDFFDVFPITELAGNEEATKRLKRIDELLDIGRRLLKEVFDRTAVQFGVPRDNWRDFLAFVVDRRKKAKMISE